MSVVDCSFDIAVAFVAVASIAVVEYVALIVVLAWDAVLSVVVLVVDWN